MLVEWGQGSPAQNCAGRPELRLAPTRATSRLLLHGSGHRCAMYSYLVRRQPVRTAHQRPSAPQRPGPPRRPARPEETEKTRSATYVSPYPLQLILPYYARLTKLSLLCRHCSATILVPVLVICLHSDNNSGPHSRVHPTLNSQFQSLIVNYEIRDLGEIT